MELQELKYNLGTEQNKRRISNIEGFASLVNELRERDLTEEVIKAINKEIQIINSISGNTKKLSRQVSRSKLLIFQTLDRKMKIVPKNAYRNRWLAIGMVVFGMPLGAVYGVSMGNMAFIGVGIPIGMVFGMAIGARMDKKAAKEGRQLKFEV